MTTTARAPAMPPPIAAPLLELLLGAAVSEGVAELDVVESVGLEVDVAGTFVMGGVEGGAVAKAP